MEVCGRTQFPNRARHDKPRTRVAEIQRGREPMSTDETKKRALSAPKNEQDLESQIRVEVEHEFPNLTAAEKAAIVRSRLKVATPTVRPAVVKIDLGKNSSRRIKEDLL